MTDLKRVRMTQDASYINLKAEMDKRRRLFGDSCPPHLETWVEETWMKVGREAAWAMFRHLSKHRTWEAAITDRPLVALLEYARKELDGAPLSESFYDATGPIAVTYLRGGYDAAVEAFHHFQFQYGLWQAAMDGN